MKGYGSSPLLCALVKFAWLPVNVFVEYHYLSQESPPHLLLLPFPRLTASTWHDVSTVAHLLGWHAALMVKNFAQIHTKGDVDMNVNLRLAKAMPVVV